MVIGLAITHPAAHDGTHLTVLKVIDMAGPFKGNTFGNSVIEVTNSFSITAKFVRGLVRDEGIVICLMLFVPKCVSVVELLVEITKFVCNLVFNIIPLYDLYQYRRRIRKEGTGRRKGGKGREKDVRIMNKEYE